jgi:hypothetical protein
MGFTPNLRDEYDSMQLRLKVAMAAFPKDPTPEDQLEYAQLVSREQRSFLDTLARMLGWFAPTSTVQMRRMLAEEERSR